MNQKQLRKHTIQCFFCATHHTWVFNMACAGIWKYNRTSFPPRPVYISSVDLKHAFFSISVHVDDQKFLKLLNLLNYQIPVSHLRSLGHNSVVYVDDSISPRRRIWILHEQYSGYFQFIERIRVLSFTQKVKS